MVHFDLIQPAKLQEIQHGKIKVHPQKKNVTIKCNPIFYVSLWFVISYNLKIRYEKNTSVAYKSNRRKYPKCPFVTSGWKKLLSV